MKVIGVIPARYQSSRFPGKPLADIRGKPMIWWVYENALKVKEIDKLVVATDDDRIAKVCKDMDLNYILTSSKHPTGTDRLAEVSTKIQSEYYINIQGDEPLVSPKTIEKVVKSEGDIVNAMTEIKRENDIDDSTVPKVVLNLKSEAIFFSRLGIPFVKGEKTKYFKQVCVYKFSKSKLRKFSLLGRGPIEKAEDIEILRFIEHGIPVKMVKVDQDTVAVDTVEDLKLVRQLLSDR